MKQTGGPEVLRWEPVALPGVQPGEALIRHTAVGFNLVDTYIRKGLYAAQLPLVPGGEAAGVIEELAGDVPDLKAGDRVVYVMPPGNPGAYSERRVIDVAKLIKLPDGISDEIAAASLLKGLTVWALVRKCFPVRSCNTVLVYAAAGGVGSILCQWAHHIGARVIGVVGSEEKINAARNNGCAEVIVRGKQDIAATVRKLTDGEGVPVVYDSLGKDTFDISLDCLRPTGLMVSYGNATGPVPPVSILTLMQKGSLFLTRPQFHHYVRKPEVFKQAVADLFEMILAGRLRIQIGRRFPLREAAQCHAAAETAQTVGSTILVP
jgi:NADPH2:quinone reductase